MKYLLSYDVITSGVKASLYEQGGKLAAECTVPLTIHFDGNRAQQSPHEWYSSLIKATREVLANIAPEDVAGISFSDQILVCLPIDKDGVPLYDAITWSDTRSAEVRDPFEEMGQQRYMQITGQRNEPCNPIRKLCWLREHEPEVYSKIYKMVGCKEYLAFKLTGKIFTDYSDASSTGAFDINKLDWSDELLNLSGVPRDWMPEAVAATKVIGNITEQAAKETGLSTLTQVAIGSGDFTTSAVGAGCINNGQAWISLGSTTWLGIPNKSMVSHPEMMIVNNIHAVPDLYIPLMVAQEVGACFKWLKGITGLGDGEKSVTGMFKNVYPYEGVASHLKNSEPGANELLFLPYLIGRGAVYSADTCGGFFGLRAHHTESQLTRAVWEGGCHYIRLLCSTLAKTPLSCIKIVGIASHEEEMLQVLCDVLGIPIENTELNITVDSIGVAIIAGYAVGLYDSLDKAGMFYGKRKLFTPNPKLRDIYDRAHEKFLDASNASKSR